MADNNYVILSREEAELDFEILKLAVGYNNGIEKLTVSSRFLSYYNKIVRLVGTYKLDIKTGSDFHNVFSLKVCSMIELLWDIYSSEENIRSLEGTLENWELNGDVPRELIIQTKKELVEEYNKLEKSAKSFEKMTEF